MVPSALVTMLATLSWSFPVLSEFTRMHKRYANAIIKKRNAHKNAGIQSYGIHTCDSSEGWTVHLLSHIGLAREVYHELASNSNSQYYIALRICNCTPVVLVPRGLTSPAVSSPISCSMTASS